MFEEGIVGASSIMCGGQPCSLAPRPHSAASGACWTSRSTVATRPSSTRGAGGLGSHAGCSGSVKTMPSHGEDFRSGGATVPVEDGGIVGVEPVGYEPPSDCDLVDYGDATPCFLPTSAAPGARCATPTTPTPTRTTDSWHRHRARGSRSWASRKVGDLDRMRYRRGW